MVSATLKKKSDVRSAQRKRRAAETKAREEAAAQAAEASKVAAPKPKQTQKERDDAAWNKAWL